MEFLDVYYVKWFATYTVFAGVLVPMCLEIWMQWFKPKTAFWKSAHAYMLPVLLAYVGYGVSNLFGYGFLHEAYVWYPAIIGLYTAIVAQATWKTPALKELVLLLFEWIKNNPQKVTEILQRINKK